MAILAVVPAAAAAAADVLLRDQKQQAASGGFSKRHAAGKAMMSGTTGGAAAAGPRRKQRVVAWEELAAHNKHGDMWIAIDGGAYDVSEWINVHPGGMRLLEFYAGRDATDPFIAYHPPAVRQRLAAFQVGVMETHDPAPLPASTVEYRRLAQEVEAAGLYKTDYTHYYKLAVVLVALFASAFLLVAHGQLVLGSLVLGAFWQQMAFCGHDALHHCIASREKNGRQIDNVLGLATGTFLGIGFSFWTDNHNAHHGVVNSSDCDPECQFLPFIAPTPLHLQPAATREGAQDVGSPPPPPSPGELRYLRLCKALVSWQHVTLMPLLLFARYKFYIQAFGHMALGKIYYSRPVELAVELSFFAWYSFLVYLAPGGLLVKVAFVLFSHACDSFLYLQTVITHFPRDIHAGLSPDDWLTEQCAGSLNWSCAPHMDWLHGGLHFQIEHHLFPRLPRHNLRAVSKMVIPACARVGVHYHCPTFFGAVYETLVEMKKVAMIARRG